MFYREMNELDAMDIGGRIAYYREKHGWSQAHLARVSGMSESAIRNYELRNRTPKKEYIERIAKALGVSYYAIADDDISLPVSVMHQLFKLESTYDVYPVKKDDGIYLKIDSRAPSITQGALYYQVEKWASQREKYLAGELDPKEYDFWKAQYEGLSHEDDE